LADDYAEVFYRDKGYSDCEQCGGAIQEIEIYHDAGTYNAVETVGCYGGSSIYDATLEEVQEWCAGLDPQDAEAALLAIDKFEEELK
jgi:hypothetical protein